MNNLSSYCGLVDAKIRASDKDLPVIGTQNSGSNFLFVDFDANKRFETLVFLHELLCIFEKLFY